LHEASIVERLLGMATAHVPEGAVLRRVHVRIGALTGLSPDSMRFYFDAMCPAGAALDVTVEPLRAACPSCARRMTVSELGAPCPECSAPGLQYENGLELDLVAIEVAHADDDQDRGEDPRQE
jgi:Zn finger protein HypA/HybF involved in hydrogenase expression